MKFIRFQVWKVVVPARPEILDAPASTAVYARNLSWPEMPIHLVEGTTDTGLVAVGESSRGEPAEMVKRTLDALLGIALESIHPATWEMATRHSSGLPVRYPLWSWQSGTGRSLMLVDTLWLDAMGKAAGLPAHGLMGGAVRPAVPVDYWANRPDAETLARLVQDSLVRGCQGMKLKSDASGDTVDSICAVAGALPANYRFTIDPMCEWRTWRESRELWRRLEALPISIQIEDPFAHNADDEWRRARAQSPLTLIYHGRDEATLLHGLRENLADACNTGGASAFDCLKLAGAAEAHGKDCWQGSALELGVIQHLRLHAAAATRNCVLASDLQSEWVREHTLVTPRMEYRDGCARVPPDPGLGISLDQAALARYCQGEMILE